MDELKQLRVLHFRAENVLGLEVVEFDPDKNCVIVGGKNRQGKSSVLDCLLMALGGAKHVPPVPIHKGAVSGSIELDFGRFKVRRSFTGTGTQLTVSSADGARYTSPQSMLDDLCGTLTLDPIGFATMDAPEQRELLLKMVGIDLAESDTELSKARAERAGAIVGRNDRKRELDDQEEPRAGLPDKETLTGDILQEYAQAATAHETMRTLQRERQEAQEAAEEGAKAFDQIKELEKQSLSRCNQIDEEADEAVSQIRNGASARVAEIVTEQQQLSARINATAAAATAHLAAADLSLRNEGVPPDLREIQERIAKLDETNTLVRAKKRYSAAGRLYAEAQANVGRKEMQVRTVEDERSALLSGAVFPVEGLDFSPDGVLYNGLPLEQEADSKLLEISLRVAMAQDPDIRVIRSKRGNDLDTEQLQVIIDVTAGLGYQLWLEVIEDQGPQTLVIEAGKVARLPEAAPAASSEGAGSPLPGEGVPDQSEGT